MKKIYKYIIDISADDSFLDLPFGAQVLYAKEQGRDICLWALINPKEEMTTSYAIHIAGTGHPIWQENLQYLGSAHIDDGALVFHVFHIIK